MENFIRYSDSSSSHDPSILQRLLGSSWGDLFLAVDSLFSRRDVYGEDKNAKILFQVDLPEDVVLGLPGSIACFCCRIS